MWLVAALLAQLCTLYTRHEQRTHTTNLRINIVISEHGTNWLYRLSHKP